MIVNQPADAVVDYLQDFSRAEEWDPGTVSCTRLDDGPGRRGLDVAQRLEVPRQRDDGGTEITYDANLDFHGLVKLAGPFLKGEVEKLGDEMQKRHVLNALPPR
jgi:hypothetical protein